MAMSSPVLDVTPAQAIDAVQKGLGLSDADLAQAMGASQRTLQRWRAATAYPQQLARRRLADLLRLLERAEATLEGGDAVRGWLQAESRLLGGLSPAEAIRAGRIDRAEATLEALDSGIFL